MMTTKKVKEKGHTEATGQTVYYKECSKCGLVGHPGKYCPSDPNCTDACHGDYSKCGIRGHTGKYCPKGGGNGTHGVEEDGCINLGEVKQEWG